MQQGCRDMLLVKVAAFGESALLEGLRPLKK